MKKLVGAIIISTIVGSVGAQKALAEDAPEHAVRSQDIKWKDLEGGGEISILYVNPKTQATYLMIRAPKNHHVPRHWHTANETITVIAGTFVLTHDDGGKPVELNAGSFGYMPAKMVHEAWTKDEGALYFITVDSAWDINWVK